MDISGRHPVLYKPPEEARIARRRDCGVGHPCRACCRQSMLAAEIRLHHPEQLKLLQVFRGSCKNLVLEPHDLQTAGCALYTVAR